MTVISEVPAVESPLDQHKNKRKLVLGWATTAIVAATILTGSIISLLNNG